MKVSVTRLEHFNAAHRLYRPEWSDEKNTLVFGKCSNPNFHGHNYNLEVKLTGVPDPETGYVFDLKLLSELIDKHVLEVLDHKNLNLDVSHFQSLIPTAEHIAIVIWKMLRPHIDDQLELKIKLYETERNCVEYPAD
ncbi:MAG: 6-carboxytetrahydropterin synthase [Cyclobacteriaceae bacterium]|nr:6-carboxytetrahydropterin synthase [Cyclobacteriaceae bacterium]